MGKQNNHNEGGIGGTLKSSLSKLTGRVTLKAPPTQEQPKSKVKAATPVKPATPKPMTPGQVDRQKQTHPATQPTRSQVSKPVTTAQRTTTPAPQEKKPVSPKKEVAPKKEMAAKKEIAPKRETAPVRSSQSSPSTVASTQANFLGNDVAIEGTLRFTDSLAFDGRLKGEIISDGALSLQPDSVVEASVAVKSLVISGKVIGDIKATDSVHLAGTAVVIGDITTASLTMEPSASFQGQGKIGQPASKNSADEIRKDSSAPESTNGASA